MRKEARQNDLGPEMLFQSQFYVLVFLPLVTAVYYTAAPSLVTRQWVLIAASLVFYGWWDVRFVLLPVAQIAMTWLLAFAHARNGRRGLLMLGIALNLASLGTFKYLNFALATFQAASGFVLPRADIILPIGISFFRFSSSPISLTAYAATRRYIPFGHLRCSYYSIRISSPVRSSAITNWCPNWHLIRGGAACGCASASA
jgi:D-alanyl-lipoteichoic acid acyltransferase DltB (MBOAT superfamily)